MTERSRSNLDIFGILEKRIIELERELDVLKTKDKATDWIIVGTTGAPAFQNGWTHYDAAETTFYRARFRRHSNGLVELGGLIMGGTVPSTMFNLPAGFWPMKERLMNVQATSAIGRVDILTSGAVFGYAGTNSWYSLDGIIFSAEK